MRGRGSCAQMIKTAAGAALVAASLAASLGRLAPAAVVEQAYGWMAFPLESAAALTAGDAPAPEEGTALPASLIGEGGNIGAPEQSAADGPQLGGWPSLPEETAPPAEENGPAECPEGWGMLLRRTYGPAEGSGAVALTYGSIKNCTALPDAEVRSAAEAGLPFAVEPGSGEVQVLIMHTHATECYNPDGNRYYDPDWGGRTTDPDANMCAVGEVIAKRLNAAGIRTLHDTTLHDYPSYNGSYAASNATVRSYLEKYPTIKVVLDVHRDAIENDGRRVAPVTDIGGRSTAQVMIICGCDKNGNLPNFRRNLAFAGAWEQQMEQMYPTLTRPVLFDYRYYNQDLTTGSLLVEIGGHGNTLAEALNAGALVGDALVSLFTSG